jgi:hypothetical protein
MPRTGRAIAVAVALLGVLGVSTARLAIASGTAGNASMSQTVTSGTWKALPTTLGSPPYLTQSLILTFLLGASPPPQYFWVVNTGSLTLTGATYTLSISGTPGASASIAACVGGTWNESTGTCSGSITTLVSTAAGSAGSTVVPVAAGSSVRLRASVTSALTVADIVTVGVSVSRSQVRAATSTSS